MYLYIKDFIVEERTCTSIGFASNTTYYFPAFVYLERNLFFSLYSSIRGCNKRSKYYKEKKRIWSLEPGAFLGMITKRKRGYIDGSGSSYI